MTFKTVSCTQSCIMSLERQMIKHVVRSVLLVALVALASCAAGEIAVDSPAARPPIVNRAELSPATLAPAAPTAAATERAVTDARDPTVATGTLAAPASDPVVLAAGDIAVCSMNADEATARLVSSIPGTILTLGDEAYPSGSPADFANCYAPTWGKLKARTRPVPGNHEYATPGAQGYFEYFGAAAAPPNGYYSFDLGAWHLIALNGDIRVAAGSAQEKWLRADLAAHPTRCALAYWHEPRFSSGPHGSDAKFQPLWQALYEAGAEIVLAGHDHDYERFAPQAPDGTADPARGIRQFVVGTGGASLYPIVVPQPNSEARNNNTWGVLKLTLHPDRYDWEFVPAAGKMYTDSGSAACHQ